MGFDANEAVGHRTRAIFGFLAAGALSLLLAVAAFVFAPSSVAAQACSTSGGPPLQSCSGDPGSSSASGPGSNTLNNGYPIEPPPGACGCIVSAPVDSLGLPACNGADPGVTCGGGSPSAPTNSAPSTPAASTPSGPPPPNPPTFNCSDWTFGTACPGPSSPAPQPSSPGPSSPAPQPSSPAPPICFVGPAGQPGCGGTPTTPGTPGTPGTAPAPGSGPAGPPVGGAPVPVGPAPTLPPPPPPVNPNPAINAAIGGLVLAPAVASDPDYASRNALVRVPTWFWLENPAVVTNTATVNGVTVQATANLQTVVWDFGVTSTTCAGAGIPYQNPAPANACIITFEQSSAGEGSNDMFASTAAAEWIIQYQITAVPAAGITAPTTPNPSTQTAVTAFDLGVGEIQAIRG